MPKSYDYEAAQAGLTQLKENIAGVETHSNTFIGTIQGAADENSAKNIKTLAESFEASVKSVNQYFETILEKVAEIVATIGAISEANG